LKSKTTFILVFHLSYGRIMEHDFVRIKIVVEGCRLGLCGTVSVHMGTDIPACSTATHYAQWSDRMVCRNRGCRHCDDRQC